MDSKVKKLSRLISINLLFFFISVVIIELFFGYWFDEYNFGPYMREHRLKKIPYQVTYDKINYNYDYLRNSLAFRGAEIDSNNIKIIMVGGSTTDERYKPEELSIVGNLNDKFKEKDISKKIINAGIEGQSTRGHIANFRFWFKRIENFKPEYIIFYIGINDAIFLMAPHSDLQDGFIKNPNKLESFLDNLKSRSIFSDLFRKIKLKYYKKAEEKRIIYDHDYAINKNIKNNISYLSYQEKSKKFDLDKLTESKKNIVNKYLKNVDILFNLTNSINAQPIFINQPALRHENAETLFLLNYSLIAHCEKKKYKCIDLAKNFKALDNFWWDRIHTTPLGSQAISNHIFPKLLKFLE